MTREEKRIWQATYSSAYVELAVKKNIGGEDYAVACLAIELANGAIRALRDRRKTGAPDAGKLVME